MRTEVKNHKQPKNKLNVLLCNSITDLRYTYIFKKGKTKLETKTQTNKHNHLLPETAKDRQTNWHTRRESAWSTYPGPG